MEQDTAKALMTVCLDWGGRLDQSLLEVQTNCPHDEFDRYRRFVALFLAATLVRFMNPVVWQYPHLEPRGLHVPPPPPGWVPEMVGPDMPWSGGRNGRQAPAVTFADIATARKVAKLMLDLGADFREMRRVLRKEGPGPERESLDSALEKVMNLAHDSVLSPLWSQHGSLGLSRPARGRFRGDAVEE